MTILKFAGGLSYEGATSGSRAQLWLIDSDTVMIDLVSKPWDESEPDSHLLAVAKKRANGNFVTPWVYLMTPDGAEHIEGSAQFRFHIAHLDDEMIRVVGTWTVGEDLTEWNFDSHLPRRQDAGTKKGTW